MASKRQVRKAARSTVKRISRAGGTPAEGVGVVKRAARKGELADWYVRRTVRTVRQELGATAAKRTRKALNTIDSSPRKAKVARRAATNTAKRMTSRSTTTRKKK